MTVFSDLLPSGISPFKLFGFSLVVYIIYSTLLSFYTAHLRKKLAAKLQCQPAKDTTPGIAGAIRNSYECIQSLRANTYNQWMQAKFISTGLRTVQATTFGHTSISTCEPENIKTVLSTNFESFVLGRRNDHMVPLLGHGIFSTDGEVWKYSRSTVRPHFSRKDIEDFRAIERHFQNLLMHIDAAKDNIVPDIQALFFKLTLDSSTEFLTGSSSNTLADLPVKGVEAKHDFMEAFDKSQELIVLSMVSDLDAIIFKLPVFKKYAKRVHDFVDRSISQALLEIPPGSTVSDMTASGKPREFTILHHLISDTRDRTFLRSQILNLMLAGRDTTSCTLTLCLFELARNPSIYRRLRSEILSTLGPDPSRMTFTSLKDCTYLQHILSETLRLYPPVPDNIRYATRDTTLPRGGGPDGTSPVFVARGSGINYNVFSMHRDAQIWGARSNEFLPERWEKGHPEHRKIGAWDYLPFNGGPRICIGQQYALANAGYVVARLAQTFERIESVDAERRDPMLGSSLVMHVAGKVPVRMVRA